MSLFISARRNASHYLFQLFSRDFIWVKAGINYGLVLEKINCVSLLGDQKCFCAGYSQLFMSEIHNPSSSKEFEEPGQCFITCVWQPACFLFCLSRFQYKQEIPLCFFCRHDPYYAVLSTLKQTLQHKCYVSAWLEQIIFVFCKWQRSFLIILTDIHYT